MGYYSEVAITLYEQDFETLIRRAAEESEASLALIRRATLYKDEENETVSITWNSIKWYDGFAEVAFIMSFLRSDDIQYQFKRVGEEAGDIDEEYNDDNWVLGEATTVECYISMEAAGTQVNAISSIDAILQKQVKVEDIDDDSIAEVSEAELLDVINA